MAGLEAITDQLVEIGAGIDILVVGRNCIYDE